jgi:hypothetical protein
MPDFGRQYRDHEVHKCLKDIARRRWKMSDDEAASYLLRITEIVNHVQAVLGSVNPVLVPLSALNALNQKPTPGFAVVHGLALARSCSASCQPEASSPPLSSPPRGDTLFEDPLFCGPLDCLSAPAPGGDYTLAMNSPSLAANNSCKGTEFKLEHVRPCPQVWREFLRTVSAICAFSSIPAFRWHSGPFHG